MTQATQLSFAAEVAARPRRNDSDAPMAATQSSRRSMPEQLRGDGGALGEAFQLRPHDRTVHAAGERALRETTICAGHDVVTANDIGIAQQPLSHELGMLDDVGRMRNEPGISTLPAGSVTSFHTFHSCS